MTDWQPIKTAPISHPILLWWVTCRYPRVGQFVCDESGSGWMCDGDEVIPLNQEHCTHWMPLPEGPKP